MNCYEWKRFYALGNEDEFIGIAPDGHIVRNCTMRSCHLFSYDYNGHLMALTIGRFLREDGKNFPTLHIFEIGINGGGEWDIFGGENIK